MAAPKPALEILGPQGMEEMAEQLKGLFSRWARTSARRASSKIARRWAAGRRGSRRLVNEDDIRAAALANAEGRHRLHRRDRQGHLAPAGRGAEVSRQGVQRDLLPLVEGTTVNTKYGMVRTDHILFIASGAFHLPSPAT